MKVLHVNIRASQGGAGRVALDLHRRLALGGTPSRLLYGYASGITDDDAVAGDASIARLGTKASVLGNFAAHRVAGFDPFTARTALLRDWIGWADVVHMHAPHHYYLNWSGFVRAVREAGKPLVMTAHDWWFITGRCGFVEDCTGWTRGCGECGARRTRDLPSLLDLSRLHRRRKLAAIRSLGTRATIVCPSSHLARDCAQALPDVRVTVIPNAVDLEFEQHLEAAESTPSTRSGVLFSASDLASPGKIDHALVERLATLEGPPVRLVGRNNPFTGPNLTYLGEIRDRTAMVDILRTTQALVFCSRMDNAPLTIMEALVAGCFVLAYESPAAAEMIAHVGGRCVRDRDEMVELIRSGGASALYGGIDSQELSRRARAVYLGASLARAYLGIYAESLARA